MRPSTKVAVGERAEFTEMFAQHVEAVWNHAYRLTGSWSKAEDLASATFLTAWRRRTDMRTVDGSALPWLYTVVANDGDGADGGGLEGAEDADGRAEGDREDDQDEG